MHQLQCVFQVLWTQVFPHAWFSTQPALSADGNVVFNLGTKDNDVRVYALSTKDGTSVWDDTDAPGSLDRGGGMPAALTLDGAGMCAT